MKTQQLGAGTRFRPLAHRIGSALALIMNFIRVPKSHPSCRRYPRLRAACSLRANRFRRSAGSGTGWTERARFLDSDRGGRHLFEFLSRKACPAPRVTDPLMDSASIRTSQNMRGYRQSGIRESAWGNPTVANKCAPRCGANEHRTRRPLRLLRETLQGGIGCTSIISGQSRHSQLTFYLHQP